MRFLRSFSESICAYKQGRCFIRQRHEKIKSGQRDFVKLQETIDYNQIINIRKRVKI